MADPAPVKDPAKGLTEKHHLYLIDGSGFIFRAYHAMPGLTRSTDGLPVGAVSGFCNMLHKLIADAIEDPDQDSPTHLAVIFDAKGNTFRNEIYDLYKANRDAPPEDLVPQFPLTRDATRAFGLPSIELAGFEADDIIATYAAAASQKGAQVTIVSSDKDLMQLVDDNITMLDTMKNKRVDAEGVVEKFGVGPDRVIDVQSLAGDSADNVPGIKGIGIKTAAELINMFGDLDTLLERAEEIKQPKRRERLMEGGDAARLSRELVTLKLDTPVLESADSFALKLPDADRLMAFLTEMEFRTLAKRIAADLGVEAPVIKKVTDNQATAPKNTDEDAAGGTPGAAILPEGGEINPDDYETVVDPKRLAEWVAEATQQGFVAVDTETTGLDAMSVDLVGVSLATQPGKACYIPLAHVGSDGDGLALDGTTPDQMPMKDALALLKPLMEDPGVLKIGQNLKYDALLLTRYDIKVAPIDDTMLMSYALDAGLTGHGMDALSQLHLDHTPIPFKEIAGTGKKQLTFDQIPVDQATRYAAEDADVTLRLWGVLKPRLAAERMTTVYETLERPLLPVLVMMEGNGIKVDAGTLSRLSGEFAQKMGALEAEIYELAGENFNIGSPKQLGEILFDKMSLEGGKKTKTGAWGTGADVLETLAAQGHDLPQRVLDWRGLSKLKSTYTDALPEHINKETGRVHTSYSLAATTTGRLASTDPNLQNIPIRTEDGRKIREAFVADEGNVLLCADYSQIELRLLAHIAKLETMQQAFHEGLDIHAMTASEMFDVPIKDMDPMVRRRAKAINFGIIYGISAFGLANQLGIGRGEAQEYIKSYFERFPGIRAYMEETKEFARQNGFVETIFGRKIHLKGVDSKNPAQRGFMERAAINAPIQGSAADVIRRAMIRVPDALDTAGLSARMLLQVHDELVFEVPKAEVDATINAVRDVMEQACLPAQSIDVPLIVDCGTGHSWAEAH